MLRKAADDEKATLWSWTLETFIGRRLHWPQSVIFIPAFGPEQDINAGQMQSKNKFLKKWFHEFVFWWLHWPAGLSSVEAKLSCSKSLIWATLSSVFIFFLFGRWTLWSQPLYPGTEVMLNRKKNKTENHFHQSFYSFFTGFLFCKMQKKNDLLGSRCLHKWCESFKYLFCGKVVNN